MIFDLVIGVDFGTSGVGVAYHLPAGTDPPDEGNAQDNAVTCLTWGSDAITKVPAKLGYPSADEQEPTSWGLQVPVDSSDIYVQEWLEMNFGEPTVDQREVERVLKDYLSRLHTELSTQFTHDILRKSWADANVSFYFSRPSTWEPALVAPHLLSDESSVQFKSGQSVVVVDAGAGTTDFSFLKISDDERGASQLEEKSPVDEVLRPYGYALNCDVDKVAWMMRCGEEFQDAKHKFGTSSSIDVIRIPHLKDPEVSLGDRIQNGMMIGLRKDLQAAFDGQLDKIREHVGYMAALAGCRKDRDYLLLSGGLGSSPYVQEKLEAFCRQHKDLKGTEVVASRKPRMAVSIGLVYDAMRKGKLLAEIRCPTSFGLVFEMPNHISIRSRWRSKWRELKERGLFPNKDSLATGVDWFLKEGSRRTNGEEVTYSYITSFEKDAERICEVHIISSSKKDPSPVEKDHTQRRIVMTVDLSRSDPIKRYITWRNKSYVTIPFSVKATIRPAMVNFRCVDSEGRVKPASHRPRGLMAKALDFGL
ncbi:hypothetical protein CEP54_011948 [Fusarium duplospermum]|uniref:Hsp70 protein n=1 Tax=Fusarium duplospermum TaxID=1325734 RepID=A0A428PBG0_9HYPO|nr:hypothetical protein CEP54_011948 [Fusarium duplospermum]